MIEVRGSADEKNASMGIEVSWILQRFGDLPTADAEHCPLVILERCLPLLVLVPPAGTGQRGRMLSNTFVQVEGTCTIGA